MIILLCISGMDKNKGVGKRQICDSSSATYSLRNVGLFSSPPKSQFFCLQNLDNNRTYHLDLCKGFNGVMDIICFAQCLAGSRYSGKNQYQLLFLCHFMGGPLTSGAQMGQSDKPCCHDFPVCTLV